MASENNNKEQRQYSYYVCVYLANFKYLFIRFLFCKCGVFLHCLIGIINKFSIWREQPINRKKNVIAFDWTIFIFHFVEEYKKKIKSFSFVICGKSASVFLRMWVACNLICLVWSLCVWFFSVESSDIVDLFDGHCEWLYMRVVNNITVFACLWTLNECPDFELNLHLGWGNFIFWDCWNDCERKGGGAGIMD